MLDSIEIDLRGADNNVLTVYIDVEDNSLSRKWLAALNDVVRRNLHLEKNYCWLGWAESARNPEYLCTQINRSINAINSSTIGYRIADFFSPSTVIKQDLSIDHDQMNLLHRYFEDLQGTAGAMSQYYNSADDYTRWHIRQLNLLCHELESLVLSIGKARTTPEWRRPSQLMCWLNAPRYELEESDLELFGVDAVNRNLGGVYVGVNKAVGKHHWEVFNDEGRDSRVGELVTNALRGQSQAAGDFDIEWARDTATAPWQIAKLERFREWLTRNGFDPTEPSLTIGHPKIGQVDLSRSFGTENWDSIYSQLSQHQDVYAIRTSTAQATYDYHWSDPDYIEQQIRSMK